MNVADIYCCFWSNPWFQSVTRVGVFHTFVLQKDVGNNQQLTNGTLCNLRIKLVSCWIKLVEIIEQVRRWHCWVLQWLVWLCCVSVKLCCFGLLLCCENCYVCCDKTYLLWIHCWNGGIGGPVVVVINGLLLEQGGEVEDLVVDGNNGALRWRGALLSLWTPLVPASSQKMVEILLLVWA